MSVADQAESIRADFAFLDDWEARFAHVIDLGRNLPPMADSELIDVNKVRGCASQVWLVAEPSVKIPGTIAYRGVSDALIVSGLIALLLKLYSDQSPADIAAFDAEAFFRDIGISDALTPQRSNGLKSMLGRIRDIARAAA